VVECVFNVPKALGSIPKSKGKKSTSNFNFFKYATLESYQQNQEQLLRNYELRI
jgi:hypothetical protein